MKNLSLLAGFVMIAAGAVAQRPADHAHSMMPEPASIQEVELSQKAGVEARNQARGGGEILFQETFSNGFDGEGLNGAWTASDNLDGNLWIWVTPEGQGLYSDMETTTGSNHPGGY